MDQRRHVPVGRTFTSRPTMRGRGKAQGLPQVYRGRASRNQSDVYDADHASGHGGGRFRWLFSTFLAAGVGAVAIGVAIFGSLDGTDSSDGALPRLKRATSFDSSATISQRSADGLNWSAPKVDRLTALGNMQSAKHVIRDNVQVRKDGRPFLQIKPYLRVVSRLIPVPASDADLIPAFNPFKLYATPSNKDVSADDGDGPEGRSDVAIRVIDLVLGVLPIEDGQEIDLQEVGDIVALAKGAEASAMRPGFQVEGAEALAPRDQPLVTPKRSVTQMAPAQTTIVAKSTADTEDAVEDLERSEQRVIRAGRGETLSAVLKRANAEKVQTDAMVEAARTLFPDRSMQPGYEIHLTLVPSLTRPDRMEPARFSVFADGHDHKVSVNRNAAGEFVASAKPFDSQINRAAFSDNGDAQGSSLYSSIYHGALLQGVQPEAINQILRIHAYETDFRRRIRPGDQAEFFFDIKEDAAAEVTPGELLYTSIITGGEVQKFWRYRAPDGLVDYYDEFGNNSRKFLMRRPVRSESANFVSGFGMRRHPVLNFLRMHAGVDWSAPIGTPIMAAGNGVIEEAKFKGEFGNYIRIRHANGYSTSYAHQSRFAQGMAEGVKVRQGQVIGFIGSTGLSTGPHLHYEVLVNNRPVDPMAIQVPRERRLTGKLLTDFQKERARIDDLMRRPPAITHALKT
jgi:murein DD-endopeptidase MepM/ murein hydrolase activator NlpD